MVLHFSSFISTLPYVALPILLYCMCGYFFLNKMLRVDFRKTYGFWVSLPIYLSAGIVLYTFILYVIGLVIFNESVVVLSAVSIPLLFLGDILYSMKRSGTSIKKVLQKLKEYSLGKLRSLTSESLSKFVPAVVFIVSFLYLTNVITIFEWPPIGDIVNHGFYVSLIIYDQRIPTSFYPFLNAGVSYPFGLHVSAAFLSLFLGVYPGEALLLFGGILMVALTSLMFTVVLILTRSKVLSLSVYALLYLGYSTQFGGNLERWLFGYLFNGPYPNIYGFLIVLLSMTIIIIYAKTKNQDILTRLYPIVMIVLLLTYPSFLFLTVLFFAFAVLQLGIKNFIGACFKTIGDCLSTAALVALFAYFVSYFYFGAFVPLASGIGGQQGYAVSQEYLLDSIFGISILSALAFSCILAILSFFNARQPSSTVRGSIELVELRPIFAAYSLVAIILFLSISTEFRNLTQYLLPVRLTIMAMMISLVLNVYALRYILNELAKSLFRFMFGDKRFSPPVLDRIRKSNTVMQIRKARVVRRMRSSAVGGRVYSSAPRKVGSAAKTLTVALVIFMFFNANGLLSYSLSSQSSFELPTYWSWFSHTAWFKDDFEGMEWIFDNVKHGQLILNDFSWDGLYMTSLGALNVTMMYYYGGFNRTTDLQTIWLQPMYPNLTQSLLEKYNVSYIFSTEEWGYYDFLIDQTYKAKPYSPPTYLDIFSNYAFLRLVFRSGDAAVFEVKET